MENPNHEQDAPRFSTQWIIVVVGTVGTVIVAVSTQLAYPPSNNTRTAIYVGLGIVVTAAVAYIAEVVQEKIHNVQKEIKNFLMERVNSRNERTAAVIRLCRTASHEFRAVTFFPAVGIRDDPEFSPGEYFRALEEILDKEVEVTLVSVSCEEARKYCEEKEFPNPKSAESLNWISDRLEGLAQRFPNNLEVITVPGDAITVNVCHNESTALMYHMSLQEDDRGSGFQSTDARIVEVAKGAFERYKESGPPPATTMST